MPGHRHAPEGKHLQVHHCALRIMQCHASLDNHVKKCVLRDDVSTAG